MAIQMELSGEILNGDRSGPGTRFGEPVAFALVLAILISVFFFESLFAGKVLSPADVLFVEASFRDARGAEYEPANRLLMDPVLQFQPWLEWNRAAIRQGRLPLWNHLAGCGAPHLANGQSAVFDPFHWIAYLGTVPVALGWMAAGRLWVAGLGMFFLARHWGLRVWGRWFAGLVFPFSGFLVAWLLYPVTPVAVWMPWLFLATDRSLARPSGKTIVAVAVVTALLLFGGHVQTAAHVLLAAGLFALWRFWRLRSLRGLLAWGGGIALGLALAAAQIVPLADYLTKSPVWSDRERELVAWWRPAKPRLLDIVCSALPYAFGSQRRDHPNLARAVGVHNLNESSGGFAGLPTIALLLPLAWGSLRQARKLGENEGYRGTDVAPVLLALTLCGFLGAYRLPPVDNLLRLLPVLNVTDNRRLGLWMVFGLACLGGLGIDCLKTGAIVGRRWTWALLIASVGLLIAAGAVFPLEPVLRRKAEAHYQEAADRTEAADAELYRRRAERRVRSAIDFLPGYYAISAVELLILAGLVFVARRAPGETQWRPGLVFALTLADLGRFGLGLNPAIEPEVQTYEPPVISSIRTSLLPGQRAIGVGEELPPNVLMRFGLGDARNYDSVEMTRNLDWFDPLYLSEEQEKREARTSRRTIEWTDVSRARERLEDGGVALVVGASSPPGELFKAVERVGQVWVARLDAKPWMTWESGDGDIKPRIGNGRIEASVKANREGLLVVRETWDEGWSAFVDGLHVPLYRHNGVFMKIRIQEGEHVMELRYDPTAVRLGIAVSWAAVAVIGTILGLTRIVR